MSMMPRVRTIRKVFKVMFAVMMILSLVASVALPFLQF